MEEKKLSPAQALLQGIHDRHFSTVRNYLEGEAVDPSQLWLSVGYFLNGSGHWKFPKPWRDLEELEKLILVTNRN